MGLTFQEKSGIIEPMKRGHIERPEKGEIGIMELVKSIIDPQCRLIGFFISGKETEFGGFTSNKAVKAVNISEMARMGFHNKQVAMQGASLTEVGNFKINDLPMSVLNNGIFTDMSSQLSILKRYLKDNKPVGFDIRLGNGTDLKMTYPAVIQMSKWFKPYNYMVRTNEKGTTYISGKPGVMKLSEIPTVELSSTATKTARTKPSQEVKTDTVENQLVFNRDIISLYEIIRKNGGVVITLPTEKYKKDPNASPSGKAVSAEFKNLGIGEVGSPYLSSSESKLNANTTFKQIGVVNVEVAPNTILPVNTYTIKTKSVFRSGENNIKKFGIAISKEGAKQLMDTFGDSLALTPITDENIIKPITGLIFNGEVKEFMEVDTSKIALIAANKLDSYIMSNKQLVEALESMVEPKLLTKFLSKSKGFISELKKDMPIDAAMTAMGKERLHVFSAFKDEMVDKIEASGINLYTGAFTKIVKVDGAAAASEGGADAAEKSGLAEAPEITLEYALEGVDYKKLTYKVISECGTTVPASVVAIVNTIKSMPKTAGTLKYAMTLLEAYESQLASIQYKIWLHKCAMFIAGNKAKIHTHNTRYWVLNTKRRTAATVYNCTEPGCERLAMAVSGIDI